MKVYVVMAKYDQDFGKWEPCVIALSRESAEKWAEEERECEPRVEIRIEEWETIE